MKVRTLLIVAPIIGLAVMMTVAGCKKRPVPAAPAQPQTEAMKEASPQTAETIEQTNCPVMPQNKIDKNIFVEYKGKKVYFCCPMCIEEFNKNPEKYITKLPQFHH